MSAQQNRTVAFAFTDSWCLERGLDPRPYKERVAVVLLTESGGGNMYANRGEAYDVNTNFWSPKYPRGESPWTWEKGAPISDLDKNTASGRARRAAVIAALSESLKYPHDLVGNNGGSVGLTQALPDDFLEARYSPGRSFGWGSIEQNMAPGGNGIRHQIGNFLKQLRITNDPWYRGHKYAHPALADTLRVQQPRTDESGSANYAPHRWDEALRLLDGGESSDEPAWRFLAVLCA